MVFHQLERTYIYVYTQPNALIYITVCKRENPLLSDNKENNYPYISYRAVKLKMPKKRPMFKNASFYRAVKSEIASVLESINKERNSKNKLGNNLVESQENTLLLQLENACASVVNIHTQNNQFMVSNSDTISIVDQLPNAGSVTTGNPHCQIDQADITDQLKHWAIKNNINHSALRDLLSVLSGTQEHSFHRLPKDPRTFLSTPRKSVIRKVDPGCYCHIGIQKSLQQQYQILQETPTDIIEIGINIDGLPLTKSSSSQFYPILGINKSIKYKNNVFIIGLYHGHEKPKDMNIFLSEFVDEAVNLTNNGIFLFEKLHSFKITMYLFDAVAKASVLYIKGHSGYSSCTKCTQTGEFLKDRVCFPGLTFIKRTHDEFVLQTDEDHHTGYSLLAEIPEINLINEIPLDYMHLVCLGVVKKMLCGTWCFGSPPHKLSATMVNNISSSLELFSEYIPSEFARKPRRLNDVKRWKATEYRQFLLYTSVVALKNRISKKQYQHFLTLSVSIKILTNTNLCSTYRAYAKTLLFHFVKTTKLLYGAQFLTHNFHNLLHLTDDVEKYGILDNFSNFACENYLQLLLKLIRKHDNPLAQVIRRISEINCDILNFYIPAMTNNNKPNLTHEHSNGILTGDCTGPEYKTLIFQNYKLSESKRDSCCMLKDSSVIEVKNFAFSTVLKEHVVVGRKYAVQRDFFLKPCNSSNVGIYFVESLESLSYWPLTEIECKLVRLPYKDGFVVGTLSHIN